MSEASLFKNIPFIWGAATSSYQVEGGIYNNDWNLFTSSESIKRSIFKITKPSLFYKSNIQRISLLNASEGCRTWNRDYFLHDFDLAKDLGLNALKISLEWARIEPKRNEWNDDALLHYLDMIKAMKSKGLIPIISLHHLTLPEWVLTPPSKFRKKFYQYFLPSPIRDLPLKDPPRDDPYWKSLRGWESQETVEAFVKYVTKVVELMKDQVDYWITLGEPVASIVGGGYLAGIYSQGFFLDGHRAKKVLHNLIEAHVRAYDAISRIDDIDAVSDGVAKKVGISHYMVSTIPRRTNLPFGIGQKSNDEATHNFCYFINDYFLNAIINGEEDTNYLDTLNRSVKSSDRFYLKEGWKDKTDFIGLNYYRRVHIAFSKILSHSSAKFLGGVFQNKYENKNKNPNQSVVNDLGWEIYPLGLYELLKSIKAKWDKPILITENGVADKSDKLRAPFIVSHLKELKKAYKEGISVIGYLHWSLIDNYEWVEGYRQEGKFGLYYIDHTGDKNLERKITKGAQVIKLVIEESFQENESGLITDKALLKAENKYGSLTFGGAMYRSVNG
jgi:beta-glucosidase